MKINQIPPLQPRGSILIAALKLFAAQGLTRTTVRQIVKAAPVHVSAISYYSADKNGLYRAVFAEPMPHPLKNVKSSNQSDLNLEQILIIFFNRFLAPLKQNELVKLYRHLHMRELVEPTGLRPESITNDITPRRQSLLIALQKYLGLPKIDDDLQRLTISIVAMGVPLLVGRNVIESICSQINDTEQGLDDTQTALVRFATSMLEAEDLYRGAMRA